MPATGKYLLDTNIVIALLQGEESVTEGIAAAEEIYVPVVVIGELYFGAANSRHPEANQLLLDRWIRDRALLMCDLSVARDYGRIKALLKERGTPLPENDIWIAAVALRHELTLATRDRHFQQIAELRTVSWQ